jgi:hypothetical protein
MGVSTLMAALLMTAPECGPERVGQIFIIGNVVTPDSVILDRVPLFPGQLLVEGDLRKAKDSLRVLWLVGVRCQSVCVLKSDGPIKDILINVQEQWPVDFFFAPRER